MPRDVSITYTGHLTPDPSTLPLYVIAFQHSGSYQYRSTGHTCNASPGGDNNQYVGGEVSLKRISNGESAVIEIPATSTRIAEVISGAWRNGACKIYAVLAAPTDSGPYSATGETVTVLDGLIDASTWSGSTIRISVKQKDLLGKVSPTISFNDVSNHMPAPGEILTWESENIVIEEEDVYVYTWADSYVSAINFFTAGGGV